MPLCMSNIDGKLSVMDINASGLPFRVGFVLIDDFPLMSYAAALEPLRAANLLAGIALYDIRNIPVSAARSVSSSGALVRANAFLGEQVDFDLVLVVAGGNLLHAEYPRLYSWLRLLAARGVLMGGVSGGPLLLARAGIMNDRRMTVHWDHAEVLLALSHQLIVERSLYVRDRDRLTCAGGTAPLDMMHALISEQHGAAFARKISDWFLHTDIRPGEGAQRAGLSQRYNTNNSAVLKAIEAMENHIADPLELSQLAILAELSVRQLNRLFRHVFATSTVQFYRHLRLQKAHALLQASSLTISAIASTTGFANAAHFSRCFSEHYSLSPKAFRLSVQHATNVHVKNQQT